MLADTAWGALDVVEVSRFTGPMLITNGDAGPDWLSEVTMTWPGGSDVRP